MSSLLAFDFLMNVCAHKQLCVLHVFGGLKIHMNLSIYNIGQSVELYFTHMNR